MAKKKRTRKKTTRRRSKTASRRKAGAARGRRTGSSLRAVSTVALQQELERRAGQIDELMAQRDDLAAQMEALDAQINALGGARRSGARRSAAKAGAVRRKRVASGRRRRPVNDSNLADALAKLLKGEVMGVTEAATKVQKAGYKTNAENFRVIVNQTLLKRKDLFKKLGRGQYTAK